MIVTFNQDLAQDFLDCNEIFSVDFDMAWQWMGYSTKQKAMSTLKNNFEDGLDFLTKGLKTSSGGRPSELILLSVDCFKSMGMMAGTEKGKEIRRYFIECERVAKANSFTLPKSFAEALMVAAKAEQEKEFLLAEQALLKEENLHLSEAVDELFDYSSIIRIAKFNNVNEKLFDWHRLKAVSQTMGVEIKKVPCPRFVTKNLYSHDVWRVAYPGYKLPETTTLTISSHN